MRTDRRPGDRVEQAFQRAAAELRPTEQAHPIDQVWGLVVEGRRTVPDGVASAHDDLFDAHGGLPQ